VVGVFKAGESKRVGFLLEIFENEVVFDKIFENSSLLWSQNSAVAAAIKNNTSLVQELNALE
jgi:hypothetical protein